MLTIDAFAASLRSGSAVDVGRCSVAWNGTADGGRVSSVARRMDRAAAPLRVRDRRLVERIRPGRFDDALSVCVTLQWARSWPSEYGKHARTRLTARRRGGVRAGVDMDDPLSDPTCGRSPMSASATICAFSTRKRSPTTRAGRSAIAIFRITTPTRSDWQRRTGPENQDGDQRVRPRWNRAGHISPTRRTEVVGWCNAGAAPPLPNARTTTRHRTPEQTGSIFCFIVALGATGTRNRESHFSRAACHGLRARGMRAVEARPVTEEAKSAAANHHGPLSLYLSAGFSVVRGKTKTAAYSSEEPEKIR